MRYASLSSEVGYIPSAACSTLTWVLFSPNPYREAEETNVGGGRSFWKLAVLLLLEVKTTTTTHFLSFKKPEPANTISKVLDLIHIQSKLY